MPNCDNYLFVEIRDQFRDEQFLFDKFDKIPIY